MRLRGFVCLRAWENDGCAGERTDGGGFDHVADGESLDRLVLGSASRAVGASDRLDVAAALLVTSAVVVMSVLCDSSVEMQIVVVWEGGGL